MGKAGIYGSQEYGQVCGSAKASMKAFSSEAPGKAAWKKLEPTAFATMACMRGLSSLPEIGPVVGSGGGYLVVYEGYRNGAASCGSPGLGQP
jgi:hypothetical protein